MKRHVTTCNDMKRLETTWNDKKCHETTWNVMKCLVMSWNVMKCHNKAWNGMKWLEMMWSEMIFFVLQNIWHFQTSEDGKMPRKCHKGPQNATKYQKKTRNATKFHEMPSFEVLVKIALLLVVVEKVFLSWPFWIFIFEKINCFKLIQISHSLWDTKDGTKGSDHLAHSWGGLGWFLGSQWDRQLKFSAYASFLISWSLSKFELI